MMKSSPFHLPKCIGQIEASTSPPPGIPPAIWHLYRPREEGIWLSESSREWGIWSPYVRGGEFELHPPFHVKSLAWWAIMRDAVLEDFRGKDCAFVANWLRGKGLNKLCTIFEGIWILMFLILDSLHFALGAHPLPFVCHALCCR